ncbi:beta-lactamase family protein [Spirosoma sp. BT702]|uniref:Beta-lactamase family protein n=1 Tax=Spirosoma profusum TaxID=2771354 RepID=A0A927AV92_9BACT|nr:serine hydrolase domain-containing protein [Spirosoma profusum]MBD2705044.1 beta-lactamase family protein [Spirosoma profusum]
MSLPILAQSHRPPLQTALPSIMDSASIPALSIALIDNGQISWCEGLGVKDTITKQPVSATTIFRAASLGKPVFAYAVLQLSQQGKIALDTPLVKYVPTGYLQTQFLKGPMLDDRIALITARMILNHTSGLPNWRTEEKALVTLFTPGSRYSYSGEGYYLLQLVVEHLVKQPIEAFMQQTVFKPLGMSHSSYVYHPADSLAYTRSYDGTGRLVPDEVEAANVAHTLRTTAGDYARFVLAAMMPTGVDTNPSTTLLSSLVKTDICQPGQVSWGLGIAVQHTTNGDLFCQWAKSPTASGYVIGSSSQKKAVVYLVNIANQGLRVGKRMVELGLNYVDPLFAYFGVRPYNARP